MDGSMAAATLASSVSAAERAPDDAAVLEKARSTAFHALAMLRAALRVGMILVGTFTLFPLDLTHKMMFIQLGYARQWQ